MKTADNNSSASEQGSDPKHGWEVLEASLPVRELKSNPRVLVFSSNYERAQLTTLHVTNADQEAVIFRVKASDMPGERPSPLEVKPSIGWIPPGQTIDVEVMLAPKSKWQFDLVPSLQWILKALVLESARISFPDLLPTDRKELKSMWKCLVDDIPAEKVLSFKKQRTLVWMALPLGPKSATPTKMPTRIDEGQLDVSTSTAKHPDGEKEIAD